MLNINGLASLNELYKLNEKLFSKFQIRFRIIGRKKQKIFNK